MKTAAILLLLLFPALLSAAPPAIPVDGTAAIVNQTAITISEVLTAMQPVQRLLTQTHSGPDLDKELEAAFERTLDSLIERRLILDEFNSQQKFTIPENVVDIQLDEILHTKFNNDRAEMMKALDSDGLSAEDLRAEIRNRMIVSLMRAQALDTSAAISPQAARNKYEKDIAKYRAPEQVELRMIVINKAGTEQETAAKQRQAQEIRKRLIAGETFAELAKQASEGTKAEAGGYWGWVEPSSRREELATVLLELKPGELSEVIEAGNSFYILKVEARRHASVVPFEDVQEEIRSELSRERQQQAYDAWIRRLKEKAFIKKF